jgi:hypothetical protein
VVVPTMDERCVTWIRGSTKLGADERRSALAGDDISSARDEGCSTCEAQLTASRECGGDVPRTSPAAVPKVDTQEDGVVSRWCTDSGYNGGSLNVSVESP